MVNIDTNVVATRCSNACDGYDAVVASNTTAAAAVAVVTVTGKSSSPSNENHHHTPGKDIGSDGGAADAAAAASQCTTPQRRRSRSMSATAQPSVETVIVKAKRAASHLWMLLHAQNCALANSCPYAGCHEAKLLHLHLKTCRIKNGSNSNNASNNVECSCSYHGCEQARKLLAHYVRCRSLRARQAGQLNGARAAREQSPQQCLVCALVARQARSILDQRGVAGRSPSSSASSSSSSSSPLLLTNNSTTSTASSFRKPSYYRENSNLNHRSPVTSFMLKNSRALLVSPTATSIKHHSKSFCYTQSPSGGEKVMPPPPPRMRSNGTPGAIIPAGRGPNGFIVGSTAADGGIVRSLDDLSIGSNNNRTSSSCTTLSKMMPPPPPPSPCGSHDDDCDLASSTMMDVSCSTSSPNPAADSPLSQRQDGFCGGGRPRSVSFAEGAVSPQIPTLLQLHEPVQNDSYSDGGSSFALPAARVLERRRLQRPRSASVGDHPSSLCYSTEGFETIMEEDASMEGVSCCRET